MTAPPPSCSPARRRRASTRWRRCGPWTPSPCGRRRTSTTPSGCATCRGASRLSIAAATAHAACTTAMDIGADAILTVSQSGTTARLVSRFRPGTTVVACLLSEQVQRQMALYWGVAPLLMPYAQQHRPADRLCHRGGGESGAGEAGRPGGHHRRRAGGRVRHHQHDQGPPGGRRSAQRRGRGDQQRLRPPVRLPRPWTRWPPSSTPATCWWCPTPPMTCCPISGRPPPSSARRAGVNGHAATVGLTLGKAVIVGASGAVQRLKDGTMVSVDCARGVVQTLPQ